MSAESLETLLDSRAVAAILGVTTRTLRNIVRRGGLPVVRVGGSVRFDPQDIRDYIERSKGAGHA